MGELGLHCVCFEYRFLTASCCTLSRNLLHSRIYNRQLGNHNVVNLSLNYLWASGNEGIMLTVYIAVP